MTTQNSLSRSDIDRLLAEPSADTRAAIASNIARDFDADALTERERNLASEIFRILVADTEVRVREALSRALKTCSQLPHDVAVALANDVNSVALPVIHYSEVLTDEDLIAILRTGDSEKQVEIAKRPSVSAEVSSNMVTTGNERAITQLVANRNADIREEDLRSVVDRYGANEAMQEVLAERTALPAAISERLVAMIGDRLQDHLMADERLSDTVVTDLVMRARERALIAISERSDEANLHDLVVSLHDNGRLTPSLAIRAVCMGDIRLFECAVAALVGIPVKNASQLINDAGEHGLAAICEQAGLPAASLPAVRAAVEVSHETSYDGADDDRARYVRQMIERVLTQWGDLGVSLDDDDLHYLLGKMAIMPPATAAAAEE